MALPHHTNTAENPMTTPKPFNDSRIQQINLLLADTQTLINALFAEQIPAHAYVDLTHARAAIARARGYIGRLT